MNQGIKKVKWDRLTRLIADLVMLNFSFCLGLIVSKVFLANINLADILSRNHITQHIIGVVILNIIAIIAFSFSGFYTKSRAYQSRFKALVIFQAVSVCFLVFSFLNSWARFSFIAPEALIFAYGFTLFALLLSRLWSVILRKLLLSEGASAHNTLIVDHKEILVIGGAGYIGSALLPLLLAEGYKIRILDTFIYGKKPIEPYLQHPNVKIIEADFRQIDKVVQAVRGVFAVVHLGAIVGDPACALDENLTIEINLMATQMIAEVCKGFGVSRFIFASTCSVYGASDDILNEHSALNPVSLYAKSKIACESILQNLADEHFAPVILRFSTIFGLSGRTRFDLVVNLLTAKACFDQHITVMGGEQWRPFLHVEDAARSIVATLMAPLDSVRNQIFNVGDDTLNYTLMQLGELIAAKVPDAKLEDLGLTQDRRNYRVHFKKIAKTLGFKTKWSLEAGIDQVIRAIRSGEVQDYHDPQFNNAKFLTEMGGKDALLATSILNFGEFLKS